MSARFAVTLARKRSLGIRLRAASQSIRTVSIWVGYGTGGGYDTTARVVARHLGNHIPGKPNVVVQNVTGAGSLLAANDLYNVAPKDGSVLGIFSSTVAVLPL